MIEVELSGGFHDGKQWEVDDLHHDLLMPVLHKHGTTMPSLQMATYRHTGRTTADGTPIYDCAPPTRD